MTSLAKAVGPLNGRGKLPLYLDAALYEALERAGHRHVRAPQRLRAVLLTEDQAV